jgi:hypothetical protein
MFKLKLNLMAKFNDSTLGKANLVVSKHSGYI